MDNQPIKNTLQGVRVSRTPRWFMRQAGRYLPEYRQVRSKFDRFTDFLFSTPDIVDVTLQPLERYDLDAAIIFSDILVVPMLLGAQVEVLENYGPKLSVISNPEDIIKLKSPGELHICRPIYDAIHNVRSKLAKDKTLIGFAGGPWTIASYMIEGKTSKTFALTKAFAFQWPEAFKSLLNIISEVTADHLVGQIQAGADVIKIFDSWAGAVPYSKIHEWVIVPHQQIVQKVRSLYPDIKVITFAKGAESYYQEYSKHVLVNGLALGPAADLQAATDTIPSSIALQGALDPSLLVIGGDEMVKEIESQYAIFQNRPYIFNLGHGILPETPPENVQLALNTLDRLEK